MTFPLTLLTTDVVLFKTYRLRFACVFTTLPHCIPLTARPTHYLPLRFIALPEHSTLAPQHTAFNPFALVLFWFGSALLLLLYFTDAALLPPLTVTGDAVLFYFTDPGYSTCCTALTVTRFRQRVA